VCDVVHRRRVSAIKSWSYQAGLARASRRRKYPLRIFIYGGRDDPYSVQIPGMAAALRREGAHESWAIYPGGHSWNTWSPHVDQMLIMASHDFSHPLSGASPSCT
jgi:enterochelin esterase-like enzyme